MKIIAPKKATGIPITATNAIPFDIIKSKAIRTNIIPKLPLLSKTPSLFFTKTLKS